MDSKTVLRILTESVKAQGKSHVHYQHKQSLAYGIVFVISLGSSFGLTQL
jgi:hypothetical protein